MHSAWASGMMYGVKTALVLAFAAARLATSDCEPLSHMTSQRVILNRIPKFFNDDL